MKDGKAGEKIQERKGILKRKCRDRKGSEGVMGREGRKDRHRYKKAA